MSLGLLHQQESIRDHTVDILSELRGYPVSLLLKPRSARVFTLFIQVGVMFLQGLNHFLRYAYVRQAHMRENRCVKEQLPANQLQHLQPPVIPMRNRSEASLGAS